jgi:hypothetical protein
MLESVSESGSRPNPRPSPESLIQGANSRGRVTLTAVLQIPLDPGGIGYSPTRGRARERSNPKFGLIIPTYEPSLVDIAFSGKDLEDRSKPNIGFIGSNFL